MFFYLIQYSSPKSMSKCMNKRAMCDELRTISLHDFELSPTNEVVGICSMVCVRMRGTDWVSVCVSDARNQRNSLGNESIMYQKLFFSERIGGTGTGNIMLI